MHVCVWGDLWAKSLCSVCMGGCVGGVGGVGGCGCACEGLFQVFVNERLYRTKIWKHFTTLGMSQPLLDFAPCRSVRGQSISGSGGSRSTFLPTSHLPTAGHPRHHW